MKNTTANEKVSKELETELIQRWSSALIKYGRYSETDAYEIAKSISNISKAFAENIQHIIKIAFQPNANSKPKKLQKQIKDK